MRCGHNTKEDRGGGVYRCVRCNKMFVPTAVQRQVLNGGGPAENVPDNLMAPLPKTLVNQAAGLPPKRVSCVNPWCGVEKRCMDCLEKHARRR